MRNITEIRYAVTHPFGKNEEGDVLVAYVIGGESLTNNQVLVFHPKERGLSASIELCELHPEEKYKGKYLYQSVSENGYVNLTNDQAKMYQLMISYAGLQIPKNLTVEVDAIASPSKPKRRVVSRA